MCLPRRMPWPDSSVPNEPMRVSSPMTMSPVPPTKRMTTKDSSRQLGPTTSLLPRTYGSSRAVGWTSMAWLGAVSTPAASAMVHRPVVGNMVVERVEAGAERRIVGMRAAVGHDGQGLAHALESAPHARRDDGQCVIVRAEEDLLELPAAGRVLALIEQDQLDAPEYAGVVQRHLAMLVPALDDALVDGREVDLTELLEMRVGALEHVHDGPALVRNALEGDDLRAFNHRRRSSDGARG